MSKNRQIEYDGEIFKDLKDLYNHKCNIESLTYNSFWKRVVKQNYSYYKALNRSLTSQAIPIKYKEIDYSSIYEFFHNAEFKKHPSVNYPIFLQRIKANRNLSKDTVDEITEEEIDKALLTPIKEKKTRKEKK